MCIRDRPVGERLGKGTSRCSAAFCRAYAFGLEHDEDPIVDQLAEAATALALGGVVRVFRVQQGLVGLELAQRVFASLSMLRASGQQETSMTCLLYTSRCV